MKIIISSSGPAMDSTVDPRFGRASYLLLVDSETGELIESIDNSDRKNASQGAGIAAAAMVADKGAKYILTGVVGPKAMPVIEKAGITVIPNAHGTVREAVAQFTAKGSFTDSQPDKAQEAKTNASQSDTAPQGSGCRRDGGTGRGQGRNQGGGGGMGQGGGKGQGRCQRN